MKNSEAFYELSSDRLLLRRLSMDDIYDMYEYGVDEEVSKYVMWQRYESIEDAKLFAEKILSSYETGMNHFWAIEHKGDRKMIGTINFVHMKEKHSWGELGYVLNRKYWNQGIMSEAMKMVLNHSFDTLGLHKVSARAIDRNVGSYRVMEKAGMKREGVMREELFKDGVYHDLVAYGALGREYTNS